MCVAAHFGFFLQRPSLGGQGALRSKCSPPNTVVHGVLHPEATYFQVPTSGSVTASAPGQTTTRVCEDMLLFPDCSLGTGEHKQRPSSRLACSAPVAIVLRSSRSGWLGACPQPLNIQSSMTCTRHFCTGLSDRVIGNQSCDIFCRSQGCPGIRGLSF